MDDFAVTVGEPTKHIDKYQQHYKIESKGSRPGFVGGTFVVDRRYSDFSWLVGQLSSQHPGVIVPPIPEKQAVGRFSAEFVESRRRALEKFLVRVLEHSELGRSHWLVLFLQANEDALNRAKEEAKAAKPKITTASALAWFDSTVNTLANGKTELDKSAADTKVEEILSYVNALDKAVALCVKHTEQLVKKDRELSLVYFELGQALSAYGTAEQEGRQPIAAALFSSAGMTADSLCQLLTASSEAEQVRWLEPLEEAQRFLHSVKAALQSRQDKRAAYASHVADVEAKTLAVRKLQGAPGKDSQLRSKEAALAQAQEACDLSKREFDRVTDVFLAEFEAFKLSKAQHLRDTLLAAANLQVDYHKKAHQAWAELLPKVEGLAVGQPAATAPLNGLSTLSALSSAISSFPAPGRSAPPPPLAPPPPPPVYSGYGGSTLQESED
eukprot:gene36363-44111_t